MMTYERMSKSVWSSGKAIRNGSISVRLVCAPGSHGQVIVGHSCRSKNQREVLVVSDLLEESTDNSPGFLENPLIIPWWSNLLESWSDSVVFLQPNCVNSKEKRSKSSAFKWKFPGGNWSYFTIVHNSKSRHLIDSIISSSKGSLSLDSNGRANGEESLKIWIRP